MKRIYICLLIAIVSITGLQAQDKGGMKAADQQEQNLKVYQQQQEKLLREAIATQHQTNIAESAMIMNARNVEIQRENDARRETLRFRSEGMAPLSDAVKAMYNL